MNKPLRIRNLSKLVAFLAIVLAVQSCTKDNFPPPPVADAGKSDTITLPLDSVLLSGSGKGGTIVGYEWSQVSGPSTAVISDDGSASTMVKGLVAGRYVFQLVVTDDKGLNGVDTTSIVVNPAPFHTLTLQPTANPNEYTLQLINGVDKSGSSDKNISAFAWTTGGQPYICRGLIKFDLSSIPATATIQSAHLYLYSDITGSVGNFTDANYGTDNSMFVQRATTNWSPGTVTWAGQPSGDVASQILVPSTTSSFLDLNLDVTAMVAPMVNNNANYGFILKLQNEVIYTSRIFTSSRDNPNTNLYPKLVVVYK